MSEYQRLEEIRKELNLTYAAIAKLLGLKSPQVFYDIKAGKCGVSKDLSRKLQEKFLISPAWLLTGEGNMIVKGNVVQSGDGNFNNSGVIQDSHIDNRSYYSDSPDVLRARIDELDRLIAEKEARIKEKDSQIKEKDSQIKTLLDILAKK